MFRQLTTSAGVPFFVMGRFLISGPFKYIEPIILFKYDETQL